MRLRCRLLAPSQRPLRICFISPYPPEKEGVADYLALLVKTLITTDPRVEITVISQVDNSVSYNSEYIGQHLRIIRTWKPNSLASLLRIRSFLVRQKFDWVHLQYGPYGKYGGVLGEPLLLLFAGLRRHAKTAITLHTIWFPEGLGIRLRQKYRLNAPSAKIIFLCFQVFLRVFCHLFDRIILLTHTTDRRIANIVSSVFRVENQRLEEWILPFKEPTFETSRRSEQNRSKVNRSIVILCPGFISPRKGIDTLLNAFQLLPSHESIRLRFVGQTLTKEDRNLLRRLTGLVTQSTLDGLVEFVTNGVDGNVIEQEARDSDVIVLPSAYRVGPSSLDVVDELKIGIFSPLRLDFGGGFERFCINFAQYLRGQGHGVIIVTLDWLARNDSRMSVMSLIENLARDQVTYRILPTMGALQLAMASELSTRGPIPIRKVLRDCDVVYFNNAYALQDFLCLAATRLSRSPPVVSAHHSVLHQNKVLHDTWVKLAVNTFWRNFQAFHALNAHDEAFLRNKTKRRVYTLPIL